MCRVLSYLGESILVEELLYQPDNSFIKQSYHPRYMSYLLNLAGFGMVAWEQESINPHLPYIYKTPNLPFYDENLRNLSKKIKPSCLLAHLRGVSYTDRQVVSAQNVHPFIYENTNMALAHNGALMKFEKMKYDLLDHIDKDIQKNIQGTTDSEWIYAVFLTQLMHFKKPYATQDIIKAILATLKIIQEIRYKHNIRINSPVNLFITDGEFIAATRFVFDYGWQSMEEKDLAHFAYHSLWYTFGERYELYENEYQMRGSSKKSSIIIASEPLTDDVSTWIEVPEYTLIVARLEKNEVKITSQDIHL